ncbi:MAG TPA: class I SAM-dependent methyltransferase [Candidatus Dormibacteraeota bacterium]|jgi:SAM-dependent methyltransferase|nr:class I SAM-dependent methyltransferase [Candidatus Dormibacteraeota bacterium]
MIQEAVPGLAEARVLDDGCGIGTYVRRLAPHVGEVYGIDFELDRVREAAATPERPLVLCAAGEHLPFPDGTFDVVISNEVIEHVADDGMAMAEMARILRPGGRAVIFCPNRWYPVEQHGVYWLGQYHFGNIPLVNYLPDPLRNRLAPHVRTYTRRGLLRLIDGLPLRVCLHTRIFGGYDNLANRFGGLGRGVRSAMHGAERTPLRALGLSHLLVLEKTV